MLWFLRESSGSAEPKDTGGATVYWFTHPEYLAPKNRTNVVIQVEFSPGNSGWNGSVGYFTSDGTGTAGVDYTSVSGRVYFSGPAPRFFEVPIHSDPNLQGAKTIQLFLVDPMGNPGQVTQSNALLRLLDNDEGIISFTSATQIVSEAEGVAVIRLVREDGAEGTVTVNYRQAFWWEGGSGGGAISGNVTFAPGQTNATFTVPVSRTLAMEGDEIVKLVLWESYGPDFHLGLKAMDLVIRDQPRLDIGRNQDGTITLSWADDGLTYVLEKAGTPTFLTSTSLSYTRQNGRCNATDTISEPGKFYRLKRSP